MSKLVENILAGNYAKAQEIFNKKATKLVEKKLNQLAESIVSELYGNLDESHNVQKLGRVKFVRARVRQGQVQRKKKFSNVSGYTIRSGRLRRISSQEKQHRKIAAKRSKSKRQLHLRQALIKRKVSLRKRRVGI